VNFNNLFRAFDAMMAFRDAARKFSNPGSTPPQAPDAALSQQAASQGLGHITQLTGVMVAALKEAFNRDNARLELERAQLEEQRRQLEEQRRRAEEALRLELRRQAVDRELSRLRLLAGTALVGWIASIVTIALHHGGTASHVVLACGWLLLLGALGAAFDAQGRISALALDAREAIGSTASPVWLLVLGLAATAISLLF